MSKFKPNDSIIERKPWYFTFGYGHKHQNCYTTFYGTADEAYEKMLSKHGRKWACQYSSKEDMGEIQFNLMEI